MDLSHAQFFIGERRAGALARSLSDHFVSGPNQPIATISSLSRRGHALCVVAIAATLLLAPSSTPTWTIDLC